MNTNHRDRAQALRKDGRAAMKEAHHKLRAIGTLFGQPAARAVMDTIEAAEEHLLEACDELDDALTEAQRQVADRQATRAVLIEATLDAVRRAKRAHRLPPDWVASAVGAIDADWLYPSDDPRHRHDTDAGGNCRGPWCTFNSDADPEPF